MNSKHSVDAVVVDPVQPTVISHHVIVQRQRVVHIRYRQRGDHVEIGLEINTADLLLLGEQ